MPQIQEYTPQVSPVGAVGGQRASMGSPVAAGLQSLGQDIAAVGEMLFERKQAAEVSAVRARTAQIHADTTRALEEEAAAAVPGDQEFEVRFNEKVASAYDAAESELEVSTPRGREALTALRAQSTQELQMRAFRVQAGLTGKKARLDKEVELDSRVNTVLTDPSQFETQRALMAASIGEDVNLPGADKAALLRLSDERLAVGTLTRLVDNDPDAGFRELESGAWDQFLPSPAKAQLLGEAMRKRQEKDAMSRSEISWRLDATLASIDVDGQDPGLLTEAGVRRAFAKEPATADMLLGRIAAAKRSYGLRQAHALTPVQADVAALDAMRKDIPGADAVQRTREANEFQQMLQAKHSLLREDPYGYLLKAAPNLASEAAAAGQQGDDAFAAFLSKVDTLQGDLGVPTWRRSFLGAKGAAETVAAIHSENPEDAADRLAALQARYKPQWPQVVRELREAKLNGPYLTLARLTDKGDAVVRADLAGALQAGLDKLKSNAGPDAAQKIQTEVAKAMEPFAATWAFNGPYGQGVVQSETDSVKALAYLYVQRGQDPDDAVENAHAALLGRYDYQETFRAPAGQGDRIEAVADVARDELKVEQFAPHPGADPALSEDHRRRMAWDYARRGIWVNTPEEDGVQLLYPNGVPVLLANGQRVVVPFTATGRGRTARFDPTAPVIP